MEERCILEGSCSSFRVVVGVVLIALCVSSPSWCYCCGRRKADKSTTVLLLVPTVAMKKKEGRIKNNDDHFASWAVSFTAVRSFPKCATVKLGIVWNTRELSQLCLL